jgi:PAS domain S-box-containing protein
MVALPFTTDFIAKITSKKKAGKTGFTYLISPEGLVLVHPQKEYILKTHLFEQPGTDGLKNAVLSQQGGTASYNLKGSEMIAGFSQVELTGWIVVFAQSRDEIMSPVNRILSSIFIGAIIFLAITALIIVVFSSKISDPIQKALEMMRQLTQHSSEMILQIGADRKIMFANPAYEKITGLKCDDLIGTEPDLRNSNNIPEDLIWESLEKGVPWSGRVAVANSASEPVTLEVMLVPFRDERGNIPGYLEIGRDISAELMYEKRLQQSQKLEAIGTLAGGIAHDFNNILSGIFGYAELSLVAGKTAAEIEKHIRQIIVAAERARDLVNQILTFSRKTEVELRPLSLKYVLKETLKLLRASIPATIDIQSSINSDSVIMAEPTQIHQVIMNLFTNANHAIGERAGTIKLELEDFMVDEEFTKSHPEIKQGKHILVRVSDTGSGIAPEILDHIFEPFFTTKLQSEGTGLGLSVVHGIVRNLGGIITVYSNISKGTTFNVIIPCIETDGQSLETGEYPVKRGNARIVIVDDETAIANTMRHILANLGYKVTAFTNSGEALQTIKTNPDDFDILITDYSMPQLTGLELALDLSENNIDLPVMLISGFFGKNIEQAARELGITELITKPINTYQLTDAIHRLLSEKQA